jgi:hypothetical protein
MKCKEDLAETACPEDVRGHGVSGSQEFVVDRLELVLIEEVDSCLLHFGLVLRDPPFVSYLHTSHMNIFII